ncbi:MAG: hypothetical protein ACD_81C00143G0005 [uncultured bacterium]|nr:MAG: hypothetical protein ACD_81C00143G0005 [uncultured bacterium]
MTILLGGTGTNGGLVNKIKKGEGYGIDGGKQRRSF